MAIPEKPINRIEHYLARANGQNVQPPEPISRIEHYLDGIAGGVPQELLDDVANLKSQLDRKASYIIESLTDQPIASFSDGADDAPIKSLVVNITPVQAGTGDPSPENVRPITGWSAVHSYVREINLWDEEWEKGDLNASTGDKQASNTRIMSKNLIPVKGGQSYYLNVPNSEYVKRCYYDRNGNFLSGANSKVRIIEPSADVAYIKFSTDSNYGGTYNNDISVNYPATDTAYHPYEGGDYTTDLGQTVYGGTLDVVSGELTVTMAAVDMGTLTWVTASTSGGISGFATSDLTLRKAGAFNLLCSAYATATSGHGWGANMRDKTIVGLSNGRNVYIRDDDYTDAAAFKAAMNGVQLVYELSTPQTYQLPPVEVKTLLGQNNIFADTGNVSVEYPADTKIYIDNQIATLQALVLENISNS